MKRLKGDYQVSNTLLDLPTPMFESSLPILLARQLLHACASSEPTIFAKHLLHRRPRPLCRTLRDFNHGFFPGSFYVLDRGRSSIGGAATSRRRQWRSGALTRLGVGANLLVGRDVESGNTLRVRTCDESNAILGTGVAHALRLVKRFVGHVLSGAEGDCGKESRLVLVNVWPLSLAVTVEWVSVHNAHIASGSAQVSVLCIESNFGEVRQ